MRAVEGHAEQQQAAKVEQAETAVEKIETGVALTPEDPIPGWVYYIRIGDTVKIGYARNVAQRMRAYPPNAQLVAVEPGTKVLERKRHQHFGAHLAHGREWFTPCDELDDWIGTLRDFYGDPSGKAYVFTTPTDRPHRPEAVATKRIANRRR
ncbi:GIY-YIG nuclease family protein [Paraoerskovia sediminicola]|uniref:GIY-YIG nuclease family protein n=1 Tax=Paraoerskovia sediminicola TaxID=1138587 RepID=UPI0025724567|nr:GIY-YIG nuclease family protein [Paraoerskovia sediminicola]